MAVEAAAEVAVAKGDAVLWLNSFSTEDKLE